MHGFWLTATVLGYLLTLVLIPWVLLKKSRNPVATIAWIMTIVIIPYFGGLLFLIFGINRVERRAAGKQQSSLTIAGRLPEVTQYQLIPGEGLSRQQERLMRLATRVAGTVPTFGNSVEVLPDTNRTLGLIEQAVLSAEQSLHLEYYIWQPDRTGTRLRDILIEKAREGVAIRFLYDKIGSMFLGQKFLRPMRDAGIEVASFLPGQNWRERWSLNLRNHRKIVIVDGQTGFTGGMNIGDEYHGKNPALGYWRDTHLKLHGPTVLQLQQVFAEDWFYATGEELTQPELYPMPQDTGHVSAQVLADGPDGSFDVFHALMFAAINEAREQITLTTSYFVPPTSLMAALETAAYRGVNVRLLVSGRGAYQWTVWAGRSYYQPLLRAGVEIHEYQKGLLHAKTLTIDGSWSLVGTPNFDSRSLFLNFEVAVAMFDSRIATQLEEQFRGDLRGSVRIKPDDWSTRSTWYPLGENVCRMFSPVL